MISRFRQRWPSSHSGKLAVAVFSIFAVSVSTGFARYDDPETQQDIARCLNREKPDGQIVFCTKLIEKFGTEDHSTASGWYWSRAHGYMSKDQYTRSMSDFDEAIRLRPDIYLWYVGRGRLYDKMNNVLRAISDFDEAIRLNPGGPDAYYFRGLAWERQGEKQKARSDYLEAVKRDASYRPPLERLAALMQDQKRMASSTPGVSSQSARLSQRAQELVTRGRYAEAEPLLKQALSLSEKSLGPDNPDVTNLLSNLGEVYRLEKKYSEARSYMNMALASSEKASGPTNIRTAAALVDLSLLDIEESHFDSARGIAERAFAICRSQSSKRELLNYLILFSEKYAERDQCGRAGPLLKEAAQIYQQGSESIRNDLVQKLERLSQKCGAPLSRTPMPRKASDSSGEDHSPTEKAFACPGGKSARFGDANRQSGSICIQ